MSTTTASCHYEMSKLVDVEPLETVWYEMYHRQQTSPAPPIQRGGLDPEHLEPIGSRDWKAVLSWITFHPDQVSVLVDREGQNALHYTSLFRAPADVIAALLYAAPELASMESDQGELALHFAIRLSAPMEVLKLLLNAHSKSAGHSDEDGQTPLAVLWDGREDSLHDIRTPSEMEVLAWWKRAMLLAGTYYLGRLPDTTVPPLHALSACPCPQSLYEFVLRIYREHVSLKDKHGRFPLTLVVSSPLDKKESLMKIQLLLNTFPAGASSLDGSGRLPLQQALVSHKAWDAGVEYLFQAEPRALATRDLQTRLYPFQLAAVPDKDGESDLTTIYSLLRADPSCLRLHS